MSDTPRTDSQLLTVKDCSYVAPHPAGEYVHADFARQLERDNAELLKEIAPLRETVGVCGDAVTSRDDIDYWYKFVDRADKAVRLETENAALREALATAEDGLRHGLMMQPADPFQRGRVISAALDAVRAALAKEAKP